MNNHNKIVLILINLLLIFTITSVFGDTKKVPAQCGPYKIKISSGELKKGGGSLQLLDLKGKTVYSLNGRIVKIAGISFLKKGKAIEGTGCQDLTGDGKAELIVASYSGGGHCCVTFHILSLEPIVKTILKWKANYSRELEAVNWADVTPSKELVGRDDRLMNFGEIPSVIDLSIPIIFCYENGKYQDCTKKVGSHDAIPAELTEVQEAMKVEKDLMKRKGYGVRILALSILMDDENHAWQWMKDSCKDIIPWLKEHQETLKKLLKQSL